MILTNDLLENLYTRIAAVKGKLSGTAPDPLPVLTTIDGMLEAIVKETDETVVEAAKAKGYGHEAVEDVYKMDLPSIKIYQWNGVKSIGGKTIVWNQLRRDDTVTTTSDGITTKFNASNGLVSITNNSRTTAYGSGSTQIILVTNYTVPVGHKILVWTDADDLTGITTLKEAGVYYPFNEIITNTKTSGVLRLRVTNEYDFITKHPIGNVFSFHVNIYDLTAMFGAGNEPTINEFRKMFPSLFYSYNFGELMSVEVTEVVSKDDGGNVVETYTVPNAIKSETGYGWSCPGAYNYVDFENKKYIQMVGSRAYASGDESDSTVITDGTNTHYKLITPVKKTVDVGDVIVNPQVGGSLTFQNNLGDDYRIPVPVLVDYVGR